MPHTKLFALLSSGYFICSLSMSIIAPFFPPYAKNKGISEFISGLIFSADPIGAMLTCLILGKILNDKNRLNFMLIGIFFQGVGLYLFVATYYVEKNQIICFGFIARIINGVGQSLFVTPFLAYVPLLFPEQVEFYVSIGEVVGALGFMFGPLFGSALYSIGGYIFPFLVFGSISIFHSIILLIALRFMKQETENSKVQVQAITEVNQNCQTLVDDSHESPKESQMIEQLAYTKILKHYPIFITAIMGFMMNFAFAFFYFIAALFFEVQYHATPSNVGYYLLGPPIVYCLTSFGAGQIKYYKAYAINLGVFIIGSAGIFIGPDHQFTGLNHNIVISLICQCCMGIGAGLGVILQIPYLNDCILFYYPNSGDQAANYSSAIFNAGLAMGELMGPIVAGLMVSQFTYDRTFSYLGLFVFVFWFFIIPLMKLDIEKKKQKRDTRENSLMVK